MSTPHKCPVCNGQGKVETPPWVAGDAVQWSTTTSGEFYDCPACKASGIVWTPDSAIPAEKLRYVYVRASKEEPS